ncbi:MAG: transposase [Proteiniphilum sp.]
MEAYLERFGCLPTTCYADKIYMSRENRAYLKGLHIRAAGKPLGRPSKKMQTEGYKPQ